MEERQPDGGLEDAGMEGQQDRGLEDAGMEGQQDRGLEDAGMEGQQEAGMEEGQPDGLEEAEMERQPDGLEEVVVQMDEGDGERQQVDVEVHVENIAVDNIALAIDNTEEQTEAERLRVDQNIGEDEQPEGGEESEMVLVDEEEDQGSDVIYMGMEVGQPTLNIEDRDREGPSEAQDGGREGEKGNEQSGTLGLGEKVAEKELGSRRKGRKRPRVEKNEEQDRGKGKVGTDQSGESGKKRRTQQSILRYFKKGPTPP